jgi:CRISPR type III-A-associated RAMP protein Csm4
MNPGLVVKLRPTGPWRIGPDSGARNRVDTVYHSDSLYAALCSAMERLGLLEEWLEDTARAAGRPGGPAVAFSSCFPMLDGVRFVAPPRTLWPPTAPALLAARVRWKSARFVPLAVVEALWNKQPLNDTQWTVDGPSECLMPASATGGPFRTSLRWNAAVDRLSGAAERHSTGCMEFRPGAGLWTVACFADDAAREKWSEPLKAAFRWLADTGFGGERSQGWGRSESPEFMEGPLPELTLQPAAPTAAEPVPQVATEPAPQTASESEASGNGESEAAAQPESEAQPAPQPASQPAPQPAPPANHARAYWLLSLFAPAESDAVDWSRGNYTLTERSGRVNGSGELKKYLQMVTEGSVLYAQRAPRGGAPDVAPETTPHPVYRAGFAVSIPLPEGV